VERRRRSHPTIHLHGLRLGGPDYLNEIDWEVLAERFAMGKCTEAERGPAAVAAKWQGWPIDPFSPPEYQAMSVWQSWLRHSVIMRLP
jgi:hypothetical protein